MWITRRTVLGVAAAAVAGCSTEQPESPRPATFAVTGGRIFDGEQVIGADTVLVADGKITTVGRGLKVPAGVPVRDAAGGTLLPGLIDAHVHGDLRGALRFGTTAALNMFDRVSSLRAHALHRDSYRRTASPDVWSAGSLATVPGGHGTQFGVGQPTVTAGTDLDAFVADRVAEGSDFIKLVIEAGTPGRPLPTLTAVQVRALTAAAHARGKKVVVHVSSNAGAAIAVEAGADFLAHVPFDRDPMPEALIDLIRQRGLGVIATVAAFEALDCAKDSRALLADPRIAPFLTDAQRAELNSAEAQTPCGPETAVGLANVRALHRAGVPVLAGSDCGNPGTTDGATLHAELALLVRAGLSPMSALAAATGVPARMFGLSDRGRIASGLRADLLLVSGDPTTDIQATRDVQVIWKNGYEIARNDAD